MEERKTNRIRWLYWQLIYGCGIAGVLGMLVVVQFGSRRVQLRQGSSRTEPFFRRSEGSRAGTCQLSTRDPRLSVDRSPDHSVRGNRLAVEERGHVLREK